MKMKIKELLQVVPEHSRIGIVARIDNGDKIETYQTVFAGHRCKYDDFKHVLQVDDYEIQNLHAGSWDNKVGLVITINRGVKTNEFTKSQ